MKKLKIYSLILAVFFQISFAELEIPAYYEACGPDIDWRVTLEGKGQKEGDWKYLGHLEIGKDYYSPYYVNGGPISLPNPFLLEHPPKGIPSKPSENMASPYIEQGDVLYKKVGIPGVNDAHTEIFSEFIFSGKGHPNSPVNNIIGRSMQSNADEGFFNSTAYLNKSISEISVDFTESSDDLVRKFSQIQWLYAMKWGGSSGETWRGGRTSKSVKTPQIINQIISDGVSMVEKDIGYIIDDMLDQKNKIFNWGWEGKVSDIDDLRCDGFTEFAYENAGLRLWGNDDKWNLGNSSDENYDYHNDAWEGFDYTRDESSPMIQSGCGGYGDGGYTYAVSRAVKRPPKVEIEIYKNPTNFIFKTKVTDLQSQYIYDLFQVKELRNSGGWYNLNNWREVGGSNTNPPDPVNGWSSLLKIPNLIQQISYTNPDGFLNKRLLDYTSSTFEKTFNYKWDGWTWAQSKNEIDFSLGGFAPQELFIKENSSSPFEGELWPLKYFSPKNLIFRYIAVDLGGNATVKHQIHQGVLTNSETFDLKIAPSTTQVKSFKVRPTSNYDIDIVVYDEDGLIVASSLNGQGSDDYVKFLGIENQTYTVKLIHYSGEGTFELKEDFLDESLVTHGNLAVKYQIGTSHTLGLKNSWSKLFKDLPVASGWAITWSRPHDTRQDLDIKGGFSSDIPQFSSTSLSKSELILHPINWLEVKEYNNGGKYITPEEATNFFTLWKIGGESSSDY